MTDFLDKDYQLPKSEGGYMKFAQWQNKFRILWSALVWWEYFNTDNKPERFKMDDKPENPKNIKQDGKVKHFRAFPVYNYNDNAIQILELTQAGIMWTIKEYLDNEKRGDPTDYDIIVSRKGEKLDTEYTVTVEPKEDVTVEVAEAFTSMTINLDALLEWENPFSTMPF